MSSSSSLQSSVINHQSSIITINLLDIPYKTFSKIQVDIICFIIQEHKIQNASSVKGKYIFRYCRKRIQLATPLLTILSAPVPTYCMRLRSTGTKFECSNSKTHIPKQFLSDVFPSFSLTKTMKQPKENRSNPSSTLWLQRGRTFYRKNSRSLDFSANNGGDMESCCRWKKNLPVNLLWKWPDITQKLLSNWHLKTKWVLESLIASLKWIKLLSEWLQWQTMTRLR